MMKIERVLQCRPATAKRRRRKKYNELGLKIDVWWYQGIVCGLEGKNEVEEEVDDTMRQEDIYIEVNNRP